MNEWLLVRPFQYPDETLVRRHGPHGYVDPKRYKPWLRDEFHFRCIYCLCRERWYPDGDDAFSVEHFQPQVSAPGEICNYENLLYACCRCNAARRDLTNMLDPAKVALAEHLEIAADGTICSLSDEGKDLIQICQLDRPNLTTFRRGILEILRALNDLKEEAKRQILRRYFGFPSNLPRLSALRPPGGNTRPRGIEDSFYEQQQRSELAEFY
jgi:hypothetical protein